MKTSLAGVAAACVLVCVTALAQTTDSAAVKARLEEVAKSYTTGNAFMGTVLVAEGDHILLDQGYGMADLEWNIPNSPEAKFRLGSLTKQFTATLVLLLQQAIENGFDYRASVHDECFLILHGYDFGHGNLLLEN